MHLATQTYIKPLCCLHHPVLDLGDSLPKPYHLRVSLGGIASKTLTAGVSYWGPHRRSCDELTNFSTVPAEGTTFIFGSWICIDDGVGGFSSHLANSREPEAPMSTPCSGIDNLVEHLSDI